MPYVTEDNLTDVPGPLHDARRQVLAHLAGRRIVEMVRDDSARYR